MTDLQAILYLIIISMIPTVSIIIMIRQINKWRKTRK